MSATTDPGLEEEAPFAGVVSGTGLVLAGFGAANALNVVFQVALARNLSVGDVGRYFEATAVVGIAISLCVGGLRSGLVRFVAILERDEGDALARRLVGWDLMAAAVIASAIWLAAPAVGTGVFHDRAAGGILRAVVVGIPFGVVGTLWAAAARGRKAFAVHVLADQLALPAVRLAFALTGFALGFGLGSAATAYVAGFGASALVGVLAARRLGFLARKHRPLDRTRLAEAVRFSGSRWGIDLLQVLLLWADTVILGAFYAPRVVGIYSVATRVVVFLSVGLTALNLVVAPYLAESVARGDRLLLSRAYAMASRWAAILTFPALALAVSLRVGILHLFGPDFAAGATALAILAGGFAVNAACGPCGVLLTMSALNRLVLWDNVVAVVLNVGLNLALVPPLGMVGAAIAWSTALVAVNALMLLQVRRRLRVSILQRPHVMTALSFAAVMSAVVAAAAVSPLWGAIVATVGFPLAAVLTRVPEERALVRSFLSHGRAASSREAE